MRYLLLLLCLLGACKKCPDKVPPFTWVTIQGREETGPQTVRRPVYRAKVPVDWIQIHPTATESLVDTTKPNATFLIGDEVKVTVHSFPNQRVAPQLQVERWQRQIGQALVTPLSRHGFAGLFLEGDKTMAWAMQLDSELFQRLTFLSQEPEEKAYYEQMGADFTIKATGSVEEHQDALQRFAASFELIEDIPCF